MQDNRPGDHNQRDIREHSACQQGDAMRQRVGKIVNRADSAHSEPGDERSLWRREAHGEQCCQRRRRSNHQKEDECHRNVRRSDLDIRQHGSNHENDRQFT
jgi:hypothetical protein